MKKYLFLMIALVGLVGMSGCSKDDDNYYNPNRTVLIDIAPESWEPNAERTVWTTTLDMPELDVRYFDQGNVSVHLSFADGLYEPIPTTYDGTAYRYEYGVDNQGGYIRIDYQAANADGTQLTRPSDVIYAKVILTDSDL